MDLTPTRRVAGPPPVSRNKLDYDTPSKSNKDRVSDATYVSMHKFSRVPVANVQWEGAQRRPDRPAPRPPSLSKIPSAPPLE